MLWTRVKEMPLTAAIGLQARMQLLIVEIMYAGMDNSNKLQCVSDSEGRCLGEEGKRRCGNAEVL
jgi:hypothetical protein